MKKYLLSKRLWILLNQLQIKKLKIETEVIIRLNQMSKNQMKIAEW